MTLHQVDFPGQKVTVTGNENREDVVCRVAKTGKHTEFWPEEPKKGGKKEEKKEEKKEGVKDTKGGRFPSLTNTKFHDHGLTY